MRQDSYPIPDEFRKHAHITEQRYREMYRRFRFAPSPRRMERNKRTAHRCPRLTDLPCPPPTIPDSISVEYYNRGRYVAAAVRH